MNDRRTGGRFDENGDWHDDHPEHLADNKDGAYVLWFLYTLAVLSIKIGVPLGILYLLIKLWS